MDKALSEKIAMKKEIKRESNPGLTFLILGALSISYSIFLMFTMPKAYWDFSYGGGYGIFMPMFTVIGIILVLIGIIIVYIRKKRDEKVDLMSQSDLINMFDCPSSGNKSAVYLIKLVKDQILVKQSCPTLQPYGWTSKPRHLRIPLRLKDQCNSHFRDAVFRCYKCGQESSVDHVKFSGPWTLIKLSCPTHGNKIPIHKIWSTIYSDITNEVIA